MKLGFLLLLATGLALAGCVGQTPIDDATADNADATQAPAGKGAPATDAGNANTDGAAPAQNATTIVPFAAEGSTPNAAFACAVLVCQGGNLPGMHEATVEFEPEIQGTLREVDLTLTWTPTTPLTQQLLLGLAYDNDEGDITWIYASGPSPVTLAEQDLAIAPDDVIAVYVNAYHCQGQGPALACASLEQPFTIEGTLTTT